MHRSHDDMAVFKIGKGMNLKIYSLAGGVFLLFYMKHLSGLWHNSRDPYMYETPLPATSSGRSVQDKFHQCILNLTGHKWYLSRQSYLYTHHHAFDHAHRHLFVLTPSTPLSVVPNIGSDIICHHCQSESTEPQRKIHQTPNCWCCLFTTCKCAHFIVEKCQFLQMAISILH